MAKRKPSPATDPGATLRAVQENQLAALLAKTEEGIALKATEIRFVESRLKALESEPNGVLALEPKPEPKYVKNMTKLGDILGHDRKAFSKWRKRFGKEAPKKLSDGREPVDGWRQFISGRNLGRGHGKSDEEEDDSAEVRRRAEARRIDATADLMVHRMQLARSELVNRAVEAQIWVGLMIGLRTKLVTAVNGLASRCALMKDQAKIKKLMLTTMRSAIREATEAKFASYPCPHCKKEIKP